MGYISRVLGSMFVGAACLLYSQNSSAGEPKTGPIPAAHKESSTTNPNSRMAQTKAWQAKKLKQLVELPEDKAGQIAKGLIDLKTRYYSIFNDGLYSNEKEIINSLKEAVPDLENLLQVTIKQLSSNDLKKQIVALNNLKELNGEFAPPLRGTHLKHLIDIKKYFKVFTSEALTRVPRDIKSCEILINAGSIFLELAGDNYDYSSKFVQWLGSQVKDSIDNEDKQKQYLLERSIRRFVHSLREDRFSSFRNLNENQILGLFQPLVTNYKQIIQNNESNPVILKNALVLFEDSRMLLYYTYHYNNSQLKLNPHHGDEFHNISLSLFDTTLEAANKLQDQKDRQEFKEETLQTVRGYVGQGNKLERQNQIIESLSKYCIKNQSHSNADEFMNYLDFIVYDKRLTTFWPPDVVLMLIDNNLEYFEKNVQSIIETLKNSKNLDERLSARNNLDKVFRIFNELYRIKNVATRPVENSMETLSKLLNWQKEKIEKPIFNVFIECLQNENVTIEANNENWKDLNEKLNRMVNQYYNETELLSYKEIFNVVKKHYQHYSERELLYGKEIRDMVKKRLEQENRNPHTRGMLYETLGITLEKDSEDQISLDLLRKGIVESPQMACVIGKTLSRARYWSPKEDDCFIDVLGNNKKLIELTPDQVKPIHNLLLDYVRIIQGNRNLYKTLLPNCSFNSPKDIEPIMRLRKNAFIALSSYGASCSEYSIFYRHRNQIINLLENNLEKKAPQEIAPQILGEEVAALINAYYIPDTTSAENEKRVDLRLNHLKKVLFDGGERTAIFNRYIESEFVGLNPDKNRKVLHELQKASRTSKEIREVIFKEYPKLQEKYSDMRRQFAIALVDSLSRLKFGNINDHLSYLRKLDYTEEELAKIF